MTYNGMNVPARIRPSLIISAFANEIDNDKVEEYTAVMEREMLSNNFPPIQGFPHEITEDDLGECFLSGDEIEPQDIGKIAWKVTDGHHRSLAAIAANLPYLETQLDFSCITMESELNQF